MATQAEEIDVNGPEPDLKRVMGPRLLLLFIVGDILGAGVYAVTGDMAEKVGGIVWLPFLIAFAVASLTALSYLELVTKYPQAAGAALYSHKAFGIHFVTFLVAFAVICSGITSASTSSNVLAQNLTAGLVANGWLDSEPCTTTITLVALGFMVLLALINLRGVGESVKFNVILTLIEVTALAIVIGVGLYVMAKGDADFGRITTFESADDKGIFLAVTAATSIAFFAMVGFEDSVNMVEETEDPEKIFPRTMLTGLGIAVIIYMLVAVSVVSVLTSDQIAKAPDGGALLEVVSVGSPDFPIDKVFPFLAVIAVANTALINMLMASRLLYGLANQDVLPRSLGKVSPNNAGAVRRNHLLHAACALSDRLRREPLRRRRHEPRECDLPAAPRRLHGCQRRVPGAAPRRKGEHLPVARHHPRRCRRRLPVPDGPMGRPRRHRLPDRGRDARRRRCALGADLADQPRDPVEEDRLPRHRSPRGLIRSGSPQSAYA